MEENSDRVKKDFLGYLEKSGVSENTIKFYESDINHFTHWLVTCVQHLGGIASDLTESIPYLNSQTADEYKHYLVGKRIPFSTINRRLSSLRKMAGFLVDARITGLNFTENLTNVTDEKNQQPNTLSADIHWLLGSFESHLSKKQVSSNTIRSYLSDIRQFLNWLEVNHASFT